MAKKNGEIKGPLRVLYDLKSWFLYSLEMTFDEFLATLCAVEAINTTYVDRTSLAIGISTATEHVPSYSGSEGREKKKK